VTTPISPPVAEALDYLRAIGYEEIYLPGSRGAAAAEEPPVVESDRGDADALAQVATEASACEACSLSRTRRSVVFGVGDRGADLMLIGEAPGAEEDRQGLPFVGPAGQLLDRILGAIELRRDEVYIANIVKCRPPGNRDPHPDEVASCRHFLERQIDLVRPRLLVTLGRVAAHTLLGTDGSLASLRGRWFTVHDVPTRVTYHPAALLHNQRYKRPTWEDMQIIRDRLRQLQSGGR